MDKTISSKLYSEEDKNLDQ